MANSFNVYLSSRSSHQNSQGFINTASNFSNKLSSLIAFDSNFSVALEQIFYPKKAVNIPVSVVTFFSHTQKKEINYILPANYFTDIQSFIDTFNSIFRQEDYHDDYKYYIMFEDLHKHSVTLLIKQPPGSLDQSALKLSTSLSMIIGLPTHMNVGLYIGTPYKLALAQSCFSVVLDGLIQSSSFVSSDIPILALVPFQNDNLGSYGFYNPSHLSYHTLISHTIDTISVKLLNSQGEFFPFDETAEVSISLRFTPLEDI